MYFRLMGKLSARRKAILEEDKEQGFTLIELLVVVVIIGILAAIAIPIYIGVQNGAKDSAAQSDLTSAKTAAIAYATQNPTATTLPALSTTDYGTYGYVVSDGVTVAAHFVGTATATSFCIEATSGASNVFSVKQTGGVSKTACAVGP